MMHEILLLTLMASLSLLALGVAYYPVRGQGSRWFLMLPIGLMCLIAGYLTWGSFFAYHDYSEQQAIKARAEAFMQSAGPQGLIDNMKALLARKPDSARGWYLLGRLYSSQNHWPEARDALMKAYQLDPTDEKISVYYAICALQSHDGRADAATRSLLQRILARNPNQVDALAMLGMDAWIRHADKDAIEYWQRLLKRMEPGSDDAMAIQQLIVKASTRLQEARDIP